MTFTPDALRFQGESLDSKTADRALRTQAAMAFLGDVGFIEAVGPEARSFLQNLGTNDLRPLVPGQGCETFFATHKAKAIAHAVVRCQREDAFLIGVESGRADALFQHLDRHLISERVELTRRADLSQLRVLGPQGTSWAADAAGQSLDGVQPWQGKTPDPANTVIVRRQGALHPLGFDLIGPTDVLAATWNAFRDRGLPIVAAESLEAIRIESGWPRWEHELDENRFVVELGRIATAISYAKGCYLGQEPIVMARDRGQVNRQLMGFRSPGETPPPQGAKVMLGEVAQLTVTSSAFSPAWNTAIGLAFIYRGVSPGATLTIRDPFGEFAATLSSLPMVPH